MAGNLIAIDPGKSGGIAIRLASGNTVTYPMPATESDLVELLAGSFPATVYVEQVGGFTGHGQPGSAMFNFGWWASGPIWIAHCYQARSIMIRPQKWQKLLSLGTSGGDKTKWKNKLKAEAQRRYPELNVTLKTADALLILEAALILEK